VAEVEALLEDLRTAAYPVALQELEALRACAAREGAAEAARRGHCLDGVEGLGRSVLYRDATFLK
jgi:hypothetical protein